MKQIRKAKIADSREILNIYNDAIQALGYPSQDILNSFEQMIETESSFVLIENDEMKAFVSIKQNKNTAFLSAIYVKAKSQRQGLGQELLSFIEKEMQKTSVESIVLKALKQEKQAINFYKKTGYKIINETYAKEKALTDYLPIKAYEYLMIKIIKNYYTVLPSL